MVLPYGPMPALFSIHCPHSDCLQLNPDGKLKAVRSNLKSEPQRPTRRAADTATDYCRAGQKKWTVTGSLFFFEHFNIETRPVLKLSLIVAGGTDELRCILRFYQIKWWQEKCWQEAIQQLGKAAGGHEKLPERRGQLSSSSLANVHLHVFLHVFPVKMCLLAITWYVCICYCYVGNDAHGLIVGMCVVRRKQLVLDTFR